MDPCEQEPEYFFNEIFSPSMFDTIAESTNRYAAQKLQQRGRFYYFYPEQEVRITSDAQKKSYEQ